TPPLAPAAQAGDPASPVIVEWPLAWTEQRAALTLEYRRRHHLATAEDLEIEPRVIVLHYTAGGSAKGTKAYFDRVTIEEGRAQLASAGKANVSSHFLVDRDGTIYRLQPETRFARHCIGLNHVAIGVENVGDEARWPLTEAQVTANIALVRHLVARFPVTHLLGHHEVMRFRAHSYYVEREPGYRNVKADPGARFMERVRGALGDLSLAGPPEQ
ncbi:MAG TPA: peptidoglycan recognition family protein, partial [Kofleriaceae bacterium]|nr:peptidoglycan recognition family protein [Kofleriaceae bacterium]